MNILSAWRYNENTFTKTPTPDAVMLREPSKFLASENMMAYEYLPQEVNSTATKAQCKINVLDSVSVGETIQVSGNGISITLIAASIPNVNEFFTPVSGTFAGRIMTAEQIANELINNLSFSTFYDVFVEDFNVIITAKDFGSTFNLTFTGSTNIIEVLNIAGTSKFAYNNYIDHYNFFQVYVGEKGAVYGMDQDKYAATLASELLIPFSEDSLQININEIVKNYVEHVLPSKRLNIGISVKELDKVADRLPIMRSLFVLWGSAKRYVDNGDLKKEVQGVSSVRYEQCGALNKLNYYNLNKYVLDPTQTSPISFLTNRPDYSLVTRTSHQYIQFIFKQTDVLYATGYLSVIINCTFLDGTTYSTTMGNVNYQNLGGNLSIDVSPHALNLQGIETSTGKVIDTYGIKLQWTNNSGTFTSNEHKYRLNQNCLTDRLNVIWFNEYGAWDSHEFFGNQAKTQQRQTINYSKNLPFTANQNIGSFSKAASEEVNITQRITHDTSYIISSGSLNISFYDFMVGLTKSTAVYIYNESERQYVSIQIKDFSVEYTNKNSEFNLKITYSYTIDNNTISR